MSNSPSKSISQEKLKALVKINDYLKSVISKKIKINVSDLKQKSKAREIYLKM